MSGIRPSARGEKNLPFLRRFLACANGIPSQDTLCDVIAAIGPELFKARFLAWNDKLRDASLPELIAIDGKTSRRTHDRGKDRKPLHLVSAWAAGQRLVLGQQATQRSWLGETDHAVEELNGDRGLAARSVV
jgi:hypothetical protein